MKLKLLNKTLYLPIFFLILFSRIIIAQDLSLKSTDLRTRIDSILADSALSTCFVGVKVISLEDSITLYELNSDKLFNPASNIKLFTTTAALHLLDSNFQFTTKIFADNKVEDGVLAGNLYIKGSGDPTLTTIEIDSLVRLVKDYNIKTISGDIIGDVSYFDDLYWGNGWGWDDEPESYQAFISPLTVNSNSIEISIKPGQTIGDKVEIIFEPQTNYPFIINKGVTSSDILISLLEVTRLKHENIFVVKGRMLLNDEPRKFNFSLWKPEQYFLTLFKERLIEQDISIHGITIIDTVQGIINIAKYSTPLDSVIYHTNKFSDNLAAENLLKTIGSEKGKPPGSAIKGITIVKEYLASVGIDTLEMVLADGSGLSPYNLISPNCIVQLLQNEYNNKSTFKRFMESLPVAGVDGTLKNRLKGTIAERKVRAKTGTLNGTSALSGYVTIADGKQLAFSIMVNHYFGNSSMFRTIQDKIIELLTEFRLDSTKK